MLAVVAAVVAAVLAAKSVARVCRSARILASESVLLSMVASVPVVAAVLEVDAVVPVASSVPLICTSRPARLAAKAPICEGSSAGAAVVLALVAEPSPLDEFSSLSVDVFFARAWDKASSWLALVEDTDMDIVWVPTTQQERSSRR